MANQPLISSLSIGERVWREIENVFYSGRIEEIFLENSTISIKYDDDGNVERDILYLPSSNEITFIDPELSMIVSNPTSLKFNGSDYFIPSSKSSDYCDQDTVSSYKHISLPNLSYAPTNSTLTSSLSCSTSSGSPSSFLLHALQISLPVFPGSVDDSGLLAIARQRHCHTNNTNNNTNNTIDTYLSATSRDGSLSVLQESMMSNDGLGWRPLAGKCERRQRGAACGKWTTFRCRRCNEAFYCSRYCQRAAWHRHKETCNAIEFKPLFRNSNISSTATACLTASSSSSSSPVKVKSKVGRKSGIICCFHHHPIVGNIDFYKYVESSFNKCSPIPSVEVELQPIPPPPSPPPSSNLTLVSNIRTEVKNTELFSSKFSPIFAQPPSSSKNNPSTECNNKSNDTAEYDTDALNQEEDEDEEEIKSAWTMLQRCGCDLLEGQGEVCGMRCLVYVGQQSASNFTTTITILPLCLPFLPAVHSKDWEVQKSSWKSRCQLFRLEMEEADVLSFLRVHVVGGSELVSHHRNLDRIDALFSLCVCIIDSNVTNGTLSMRFELRRERRQPGLSPIMYTTSIFSVLPLSNKSSSTYPQWQKGNIIDVDNNFKITGYDSSAESDGDDDDVPPLIPAFDDSSSTIFTYPPSQSFPRSNKTLAHSFDSKAKVENKIPSFCDTNTSGYGNDEEGKGGRDRDKGDAKGEGNWDEVSPESISLLMSIYPHVDEATARDALIRSFNNIQIAAENLLSI